MKEQGERERERERDWKEKEFMKKKIKGFPVNCEKTMNHYKQMANPPKSPIK